MIIGISGAHGVGKTTLLNALRKEKRFELYAFRDEVTRNLLKQGYKINKDGDDVTQIAIMKEHVCNVTLYPDMITDRTSLDGYVYTQYLYDQGKVSRETYQYAAFVLFMTKLKYEALFYIPPEFPLVADEVRSDDIEFRDDIARIFEKTLNFETIAPIPLRGTVEQRVNTILEYTGGLI